MNKSQLFKVNYIFKGNSYECILLIYTNDRIEKMLPNECIIVEVTEIK
jgi:hypothetical protein